MHTGFLKKLEVAAASKMPASVLPAKSIAARAVRRGENDGIDAPEPYAMTTALLGTETRRVRDIMTTPVQTLHMDDSILSAKAIFDRERFHHAVVLEGHEAVGVVSDRDVLKAISPFVGRPTERTQDAETLQRRVHQIMSRTLVIVGPDESVAGAARKMADEHVSCLPVLDERHRPIGIVTLRDLAIRGSGVLLGDGPRRAKEEQDAGVLIIVDGARCYRPHVSLGRVIREAEALFTTKFGAGAANAQPLPRIPTAKVQT